ncbi:MAG: AMP-binding protein [Myxococcota bacterium]|nr:AMP-binding protein [Myxococcota bacterium]
MRSPSHNIASWIANHAERDGSRLALADDERRLSYADLESRIARFANWLKQAGIQAGDRVGVLLGNRSAALESVFAAGRLGAIALPINTRLSAREISFILDDSRPSALVSEPRFADLAEAACRGAQRTPDVRLQSEDDYEAALAASQPLDEIAPVDPDDPVLLMYTSGTTGSPKGALLPHRKALYNSRNAEIYFGIEPRDRVLVVSPLFHSLGLQILSLPVLYCGASLIVQAHFEPEALLEAVETERISYLGAVPTVYQRLLELLESGARKDLSSLRFLFTAGAAAPAELVRAYRRHGLCLVQGYGQTETSTLTCLPLEDAERKQGSVGLPVQHAELRIISPESLPNPVPEWRDSAPGTTGEIVVKGPIVMLGYWERPEANREALRDGWLRTGDLATRDEEGFISLVGRSREMFISGGENVYPAEVEACYGEHPAVREIAVIGVPDERWGETGRAHVVPQANAVTDPDALEAWGRERLAGFKIPSHWIFERDLPKTASGKVQKHKLRAEPS